MIINNLKSHNTRNQKSSFMIISTIIFIMFVQGFTQQLESQSVNSIRSYVGSDFSIIPLKSGQHTLIPKKRDKLNNDLNMLDEDKFEQFFEQKKSMGIVESYNFGVYCLSSVLNDPFYLESSYNNLELHLGSINRNHFSIYGYDNM